MTLQSPKYWYKRLDELNELNKQLQKSINQNKLNIAWIRQEIATREEMQDYPGATA